MQPITMRQGMIAINGGHLQAGDNPMCGLVLNPELIENKQFVTLKRHANHRLKKFLNNDFTMYDLLVARRNRAVESAMGVAEIADSDETSMHEGEDEPTRKRAKRALIDNIPKILEIRVRTDCGQTHTVCITSHRYAKHPLKLEATIANFEFLLLTPHADELTQTRGITVEEPNVRYIPSLNALLTHYYCRETDTWKRKTSSKISASANQAEVNAVASRLQNFFERNHSEVEVPVEE